MSNTQKKETFFIEAEKLYVEEFYIIGEIARQLKLSGKTISNWKKEGDWENKRKKFLEQRKSLHQDIYELARDLAEQIKTDIQDGKKIETGRIYAIKSLVALINKTKFYEDLRKEEEKLQNISKKDIVKEVSDILGIKE